MFTNLAYLVLFYFTLIIILYDVQFKEQYKTCGKITILNHEKGETNIHIKGVNSIIKRRYGILKSSQSCDILWSLLMLLLRLCDKLVLNVYNSALPTKKSYRLTTSLAASEMNFQSSSGNSYFPERIFLFISEVMCLDGVSE